MVGKILVCSQRPTTVTAGGKQLHEPTRSRFIAGVEPNCSTDRIQFGLTGTLELARSLPCGSPHRPAQLVPLCIEPSLEVWRAGNMKARRKLARPACHRIVDPRGGKVRPQLERIASERIEVETDECLASGQNCLVAERLSEGVKCVSE
jgi:hypothetical protein